MLCFLSIYFLTFLVKCRCFYVCLSFVLIYVFLFYKCVDRFWLFVFYFYFGVWVYRRHLFLKSILFYLPKNYKNYVLFIYLDIVWNILIFNINYYLCTIFKILKNEIELPKILNHRWNMNNTFE